MHSSACTSWHYGTESVAGSSDLHRNRTCTLHHQKSHSAADQCDMQTIALSQSSCHRLSDSGHRVSPANTSWLTSHILLRQIKGLADGGGKRSCFTRSCGKGMRQCKRYSKTFVTDSATCGRTQASPQWRYLH